MNQPRNLIPPNNLPPLDAAPHAPRMAMRRLFQQAGARDHRAYVLQLNAVRLGDSSIAEYELARLTISAYHEDSTSAGIRYITRASGHFESCIWSFERFIKHAKALRSAQFVPEDLRDLVPRSSSFLHSSVEKRITRMRHALAHLEGEALSGRLPPGTDLILLALQSGLSIGSHQLEWPEFTTWLSEVHTCAGALADYVPTSAEEPPNAA
jgi:hypothetical protein